MSVHAALNRLAKWRSIFAGWQLGTRAKGDPESDAVRDHREVTILMRAELSALVYLLVERKVFTEQDWSRQLEIEANELSKAYERKFPGAKATDIGMDLNVALWRDTTQGWRP
jgi:hypothetical protein